MKSHVTIISRMSKGFTILEVLGSIHICMHVRVLVLEKNLTYEMILNHLIGKW